MTTLSAHILVIDDDPLVRLIASKMLGQAGYRVSVAEDGDEGLKLVKAQAFDLVVTDLIMPNKEGVETIRELRHAWPDLPIIAISSGGRLDVGYYLPLAKAMGATAVLQKPLKRESLLPLIEQALTASRDDGWGAPRGAGQQPRF